MLRSLRRLCTILPPAAMVFAAGGVAAQEHSATLKGVVFDATTGYALSGVAVYLNQNPQAALTDSLGEYSLAGLSIGNYTLTLAKRGFGPQVISFAVTESHRDTVEIGSLPLQPTEAVTAAISGSVLDSRTGQPVIAVGVSVNGDFAAFSSERGFTTGRLEVLPGLNTLEFKRIGYEPFTASLWAVRNHTDLDLAVTLDPLPVQIQTVVVEADQTTNVHGVLREFYQRRQWGLGHYFTQQDIEQQHPFLISDMLRLIPGVVVRSGMYGGNRVEAIGNRGITVSPFTEGCGSMRLFIDGQFIETNSSFAPSEELDLLVQPENVAAIEVYPRPTGIPVQYNNRGSMCGVILVWTR